MFDYETATPEELQERLTGGDDQALGHLFAHYRERLWRMAYFRMHPKLAARLDPDDVLQEAFIDASKRIDAWRDNADKSFFIWLRLILGQTLADLHRRHLGAKKRDAGRELNLHGVGPRASMSSVSPQLIASLTSPSQAAARAEGVARLEEVMAELDPIDREILTLRHFEELSNGEVSELLGLKPSAASNRYIRALTRIRAAFNQNTDDSVC